jgi:hypothetical protein
MVLEDTSWVEPSSLAIHTEPFLDQPNPGPPLSKAVPSRTSRNPFLFGLSRVELEPDPRGAPWTSLAIHCATR